ncbi:TIGR02587 family membrane protein [Pelagibacterium luteolum]|uniref:Putative integral membrane protein TIGR02587 n=1 Tax=Pelagibacterium luteolum TaxID=440168 RepID=A0A1G7WIJ2_9HYPH|nr:TIGR02587 family membrane protein [Pelagibacterium luteolum]SDG71837.1 putative integral membrane protein TIGR02587 [Pelagibacterium luteolum]
MTSAKAAHGVHVDGLMRAVGGALIFSLPMLMTMEMWQLGVTLERWRVLLLLVAAFPILMLLSREIGFEKTGGWREDFRDVMIAYAIGIVTSAGIMLVLAIFSTPVSLIDVSGKIALQTVPAALGALLGRAQFGGGGEPSEKDESFGGELVIMAAGALFLSLNVAPTEEMQLISFRMTAWHALALIPVSLLIMHAFVFAASFSGGSEVSPETPWWSAFLRFTVSGYMVALVISFAVLWLLGQVDGMSFERAIRVLVVLGFPAAIGAAAARLIL